MAEPENDRIDKLLDSLLSNYSSAQPRPGLETRIVANLQATAARKGPLFLNWRWAAALAAVIMASVMFYFWDSPSRTIPHTPPLVQKHSAPEPAATVKSRINQLAVRAKTHHHSPATRVLQVADDRPEVFPTPTPLSEQEKLLLRYMAGTPREEIMAQSHPDEEPEGSDSDGHFPDLTQIPQRQSNTR